MEIFTGCSSSCGTVRKTPDAVPTATLKLQHCCCPSRLFQTHPTGQPVPSRGTNAAVEASLLSICMFSCILHNVCCSTTVCMFSCILHNVCCSTTIPLPAYSCFTAEFVSILLIEFSLFTFVATLSHCLCLESHYLSIKLYRIYV
jgi:hypothetical protein